MISIPICKTTSKNLGMIKVLFDGKSITIDWKFQFNKNDFFIIGKFQTTLKKSWDLKKIAKQKNSYRWKKIILHIHKLASFFSTHTWKEKKMILPTCGFMNGFS